MPMMAHQFELKSDPNVERDYITNNSHSMKPREERILCWQLVTAIS